MDIKIIGVLGLAAVVIIARDVMKFRGKKNGGRAVIIGPAAGTRSWSSSRVFFGWVISFLALNLFGFIALVINGYIVSQDGSALWMIGTLIGWLLACLAVQATVFPKPYREYLNKKETAPLAALPSGLCALGWIVMMLAGSWTWLNDI